MGYGYTKEKSKIRTNDRDKNEERKLAALTNYAKEKKISQHKNGSNNNGCTSNPSILCVKDALAERAQAERLVWSSVLFDEHVFPSVNFSRMCTLMEHIMSIIPCSQAFFAVEHALAERAQAKRLVWPSVLFAEHVLVECVFGTT
ncbi:hypothetical protein ACFE04_002400 [Oxalis oulophora]